MEGNRPLRWVAIAAASAVALVVAAAVVAYATIDTQAIARYAAAEVTRLTGRTVAARGPLTIAFWPRLAVVAHDVTISNPPGASRPELARARVIRGAVATWPLLRSREVVAEGIEIEGLDIVLETLPDGRGNWQLPASAPAPNAGTPAATSRPFRLAGTIALVDAKVAWRPVDGRPLDVVVPRLEVAAQDGGRLAWRGTFDVDATRWTLDATSGDPQLALRERVPLDVDARLAGGGVTLAARGRIERRDRGPAAVLDASVAWDAGSDRMARWAPQLARESGRVAARLDVRDRRYVLDGIAGAFGPTKFDGTATLDRSGERPRLGGRLHVDTIDLMRERPAVPAAAAVAKGGAAGPAKPSPLAAVDADVDFVIDRLRGRLGVEATNARGRVVVTRGTLEAPMDVDVGGGRVSLAVHADAATSRARFTAEGRGIEVARLARASPVGRNVAGGATSFAVDLAGPAQSLDGFLAQASGTIRVDIGPLQVKGAELDATGEVFTRLLDTLNPFRRADPSTEVQCVVARLVVKDGIAHADRTLAAETSRLALAASGTIDLGRGTIDLLVRPRARRIASMPTVELADVVRVSGPIAHPTVKLDTMGAARTALTIGGAIATGGWSLLATPLLNAADDPSPCATARAGGRPAGTSSSAGGANADLFAPLRGLLRR